jgi:tRNA pseudouridine55 synthase
MRKKANSPAGSMDGILLVDKPKGWTSHDVVAFVRARLKLKKTGHAGTLDPMAKGLLILLLGRATKSSNLFLNMDKTYKGSMKLGMTTDTWDAEGTTLGQSHVPDFTKAQLETVFQKLTGKLDLEPPQYSAIKKNGQKAYEAARRGQVLQLEKRPMTVYAWKMMGIHLPEVRFSVDCSKGTYVRALTQEAGRVLGCGATLTSLERTRVGPYELRHALSSRELSEVSLEAAGKRLIKIDESL